MLRSASAPVDPSAMGDWSRTESRIGANGMAPRRITSTALVHDGQAAAVALAGASPAEFPQNPPPVGLIAASPRNHAPDESAYPRECDRSASVARANWRAATQYSDCATDRLGFCMSFALARAESASLTPLERLETLCDRDTLDVIRSEVISERMGDKALPGDGVIGGCGLIGGGPSSATRRTPPTPAARSVRPMPTRSCVCWSWPGGRAPPSSDSCPPAARGCRRASLRLAATAACSVPWSRFPVACRRSRSSTGLSAGGGAYAPALSDWIVMTQDASMFLTGPSVVREALGETVDARSLGGPRVHMQQRRRSLRLRRDSRRTPRICPRSARLSAESSASCRFRASLAATRRKRPALPACPSSRGASTTCAV